MRRLMLIGMVLFTTVAFAGGRESGGGAAWVCRNGKEVLSAKLYDTFFPANDTRVEKEIYVSEEDPKVQIERALERLNATNTFKEPMNSNSTVSLIRRALGLVERDWLPLKERTRLPFLPDVKPEFLPDEPACELETIAHYYDNDGNLRVNMRAYEKLSKTDKAALKMHEALYKIDRLLSHAQNSDRTVKRVAELFSHVKNSETNFIRDAFSNLSVSISPEDFPDKLNPLRFELFFGGRKIFCEDPKDSRNWLSFAYERRTDASSGLRLTTKTSGDPIYWDMRTEARLKKFDTLLISGSGSSDRIEMRVPYIDLLHDSAYLEGKKGIGRYKYENERGAGDIELDMECQFK